MNSNVLGKRIELLRTENNLNQIRLAKILNIGNTTLSQYESGKRIPSDEIKLRIAEIFGVSLDWLLGISDIRNPYASTSGDIDDILETIRRRPEMKALFSLSKNATKEDIERTVKIIEALIGDQIENCIVRLLHMPTTVKGVVIPDEDNNYNIYINNCLNYESQLSTLKHELTHIKYNHFDSNKHVVLLEKETE